MVNPDLHFMSKTRTECILVYKMLHESKQPHTKKKRKRSVVIQLDPEWRISKDENETSLLDAELLSEKH